MENTLSINWGSGHADVYADQFFPCTLETFKKLMKLIALDYEHRQDHSEWLRRYFIGRVDRAKVDLPVWVKAYSNAKQQVADFKRVLETRKWPNGIYVTNTEVVQESLAEYRAKRNAAETEIKRCQKDIKSLTRCLEILEEGG